MKKHLWPAAFAACLTAFTIYIALDTFVLTTPMQTNATEMNMSVFEEESVAQVSPTPSGSGSSPEVSSSDEGSSSASSSEKKRHKSRHDSDDSGAGSKSDDGDSRDSGSDSDSSDASDSSDRGSSDASDSSSRDSSSRDSTGTQDDTVTAAGSEVIGTYEDENMTITVTRCTVEDTEVYTADVKLSSAQYLKTAFAEDTYGRNVTETTSDMAAAKDAVLAVNGDYYGAQETGYVIRNGVVYRETAGSNEVLCIYPDGTMEIVDPSEVTAQELADRGVWQAFSFGPALVESGEIAVSEGEEVGKAMADNPRTAIGVIDTLHYVLVVSDGRTDESEGLSLRELASYMQSLGVQTAYNLDGGGSSTMVFQGTVVNNPTTTGNRIKEREVSDIVYIG